MSNYDDDQSEDGELARSPVKQDDFDFSLSEDDDMEAADSLDIRPPQVKLIGSLKDRTGRHGKSSRRKEHPRRDKKHGFRERDKLDSRGKKDSDVMRVVERDTFHSKEHYRDRDREREREYIREKEVYREREHYREKEGMMYGNSRDKEVYSREKEVDVYREKDSYRYKEPYREKEVYRERERRVADKDSHRDKESAVVRERERERERYIEAERNKDRKEKELRERERASGGTASGDKELEDLRSRLLSKRREQQQEKREENPEARKAHLERTNKLLLADRETSRRKEEGRMALEERRSRRSKRPPSPQVLSPSPPHSVPPVKKSRPSVSPSTEVVSLSDNSDIELPEEGQHSGSSSPTSSTASEDDTDNHSGTDSDADRHTDEEEEEEGRSSGSRGEHARDRDKERNIHEDSVERDVRRRSLSRSPLSERSEHSEASPKDRRSRSRSRESRGSRSHSFSPPKDTNGEEVHQEEEPEKKKEEEEAGEGNTPPHSPGPSLPPYYPAIQGCRSVEEFQCLNRIEEGTYGVVYRAKDKTTDEIVALKRLKMEKEKEGFPITSLREINTLLKGQHPNIVTVREIVVGSNMDKIFIVMDYVEHDLKGLMETMRAKKQVFLPGEVKCLMQQLLKAVDHLHDNWILHRDLKTSNLLLSHKGILKVGDFGLAREYGSPLKNYTPIVVTLWYRAPELLLGARTYSTPIDIWSVGCIFAEFLTMQALFPGKSEVDQLNRIFKDLGTPNETVWPGWSQLSGSKAQWADQPGLGLRKRVGPSLSDAGLHLLQGLLTYDPTRRLQASGALAHNYFKELPQAIDPAMFPTWPAKSEGAKRQHSPKPPPGGDLYKQLMGDDVTGFHMGSTAPAPAPYLPPPPFALKF